MKADWYRRVSQSLPNFPGQSRLLTRLPTPGERNEARAEDRWSIRGSVGFLLRSRPRRDPAGLENLGLRGVGAGEGHVFADSAVDQKRLLKHYTQLGAVGAEPHGGEIDAVDSDDACRGGVEGRDESDNGRFARARRPTSAVTVPGAARKEMSSSTSWLVS